MTDLNPTDTDHITSQHLHSASSSHKSRPNPSNGSGKITLTRMCTDREIMRVSRDRYKAFQQSTSPQTNQRPKTTETSETFETTETIDINNPPHNRAVFHLQEPIQNLPSSTHSQQYPFPPHGGDRFP